MNASPWSATREDSSRSSIRSAHRWSLPLFLLLSSMLLRHPSLALMSGSAAQIDAGSETRKGTLPRPSLLWLFLQFVPSPQWTWGSGGSVSFGMRWQMTPLLYSFGVNDKVSPWRAGIVDPVARQGGSVEIFLTPEYMSSQERWKDRWMLRAGTRAYFPLWQKGEYLSWSLGVSYYSWNGNQGITYEGGVYLFGGFGGAQLSYSPRLAGAEWTGTFRVRFF